MIVQCIMSDDIVTVMIEHVSEIKPLENFPLHAYSNRQRLGFILLCAYMYTYMNMRVWGGGGVGWG